MRRRLAAACPAARVLDGHADHIPVADDSVDAIFAAEAFHLFDGERALAEFTRVLRPRGALVVMWNLPVRPADPAIAAVEQLLIELAPDDLGYDPVDLNSSRYASGEWRIPFAASLFEQPQEMLPRQVGMYLTRRLTALSLEQIGAYFGGRDHSTVLHACRKVEEALDRDVTLSGAVRELHPWAVDVCSGVEAEPGRKDPAKLRAFVAAVREADRA